MYISLENHIILARYVIEKLARTHNGGWWGPGLVGYCGIASRFLLFLLRRHNIPASLCIGTFDGMYHCWVRCGKLCIDITISQFYGFEGMRYNICSIEDEFYVEHYKLEREGKVAEIEQKHWGRAQNYERHQKDILSIYKTMAIKKKVITIIFTLMFFMIGCADSNQIVKKSNESDTIISTQRIDKHSSEYNVHVADVYIDNGHTLMFTFAYNKCWRDVIDTIEQKVELPATYVYVPYAGNIA